MYKEKKNGAETAFKLNIINKPKKNKHKCL